MIAALRKLVIAWMASVLFACWSGALFLAGFGLCYAMAIDMLARAK